jgi:ribonuclease HI
MQFNSMRLNALKCELVGRGADGEPVTAAAVAAHGITVDGIALAPHPHDQPIRYLGAHSCFDGSWGAQQRKTRELIMIFTRAVSKFRVSVGQAVYMFNVFLRPKLELALHYVHGPGTAKWIHDCDRMMIGSIKHAAASPLMLSHSAVALTLGLKLPSWLEVSVKVSELFLRLNSSDPRWGHLGRMLMRNQCGSIVSSESRLPLPNSGTRFTRAAYLAVRRLQWTLQLEEEQRAGSRREHMFAAQPATHLPALHSYSSLVPSVELTSGRVTLAHDSWVSWGTSVIPQQPVQVYTDGSFDQTTATSAWAVVIGDAWLDSNYGSVPAHEQLLRPADVGGATLIGASIACTQGVYPAELQAIARTLAMLPASYHLHIHSDSHSSLDAISTYAGAVNERCRMRMAARPLLALINHQLEQRQCHRLQTRPRIPRRGRV